MRSDGHAEVGATRLRDPMSETLIDTENELQPSPDEPSVNGAEQGAPDGRPQFGQPYVALVSRFQEAIDERGRLEEQLAAETSGVEDEEERRLARELADIRAARGAALADLDAEFERIHGAAVDEFDSIEATERSEHLATLREIEGRYSREAAEVEARYHDSSWVTSSVLDDTAEDSPRRQFERATQLRERVKEQQTAEWSALEGAYQALAEERGWGLTPLPEPELQCRSAEEAQQLFGERVEAARGEIEAVRKLKIPRLFQGYRSLVLFLLLTGALAVPIGMFVNPHVVNQTLGRGEPGWWGIAAGAAAVCSLILLAVVYTIGSMQQSEVFGRLQQSMTEAAWLHQRWLAYAKRDHQRMQADFAARQADFEAQRRAALERYEKAHQERSREIEQGRMRELQTENARYGELQGATRRRRETRLTELERGHRQRRESAALAFDEEEQRRAAALEAYSQQRRRRQAELWHQLKSGWDAATRQLAAELGAAQADSRNRFAEWEALASGSWHPPAEIPSGIRLGEFDIDLERWEHAIPADIRLAPRSTHLSVPAVAPFPSSPSLLLKATGAEARRAAVQVLQTAMLRMLTLIPPGKLRFTILDPVGLGESFAGFMHLADFDELLVTKRIWTEPDQIEEQLADLTEHMENVLQKYLRNEFATIEQYNEFAGEVAEPYRILVITDFPAKFSEIAARRLTSILTSGPRCGVYTLLSMDPKLDLPHSFNPAVFDETLPTLVWRGGAFHATRGELSPWPLRADEPPPPEQFTAIVRRVGEASKDARRVEVSFERIAPKPDQLWTQSSQSTIDVPLGRAGATKLQHLQLGRGTSQHMLVAGKTGSGKSTFLHCLITNIALHYSPEEVRFYLIDFKKGVEFKDYAQFQFPHADVIAIESDREFGVSALQRLDGVLQERGELFRRHGVQDLAGYRKANADSPLPRILLVIDEFQEFFVEDDKLSQTASLLLDRLVRQGRAFGMHVVLGSQTLGGAYSLARSTMGQVAVRVALQCSEADAHLILSEENTAARLLTRPGEAIYNDANGLLEGNHPFQIAWLPDDQRETWLRRLRSLAEQRGLRFDPPIVFEGNIPSDPARNVHLTRLLSAAAGTAPHPRPLSPVESLAESGRRIGGEGSASSTPASPPRIWLGEAVEIKQPTDVVFHRQSGANVLLVGQDAEAALGILATSAITLAAESRDWGSGVGDSQLPSGPSPIDAHHPPPITVLDGSPADAPEFGMWRQVADAFSRDIRLVHPREAAAIVRELAAEVEHRNADSETQGPPRFLIVYNVSRFRDLRKAEDDFGMGAFGGGGEEKPAEPGKLFADILANGPAAGVHCLIWCDSPSNLDRWFSRQSLRELEYRIAFQMNASDSSNLIDSPAASRLGMHRALLYREETGQSEKFRPYGVPDPSWLNGLRTSPPAAVAPSEMTEASNLDEFQIL